MGLHLIKMAAGISSLVELQERQDFLRAQLLLKKSAAHKPQTRSGKNHTLELMHVTRYFPKRADEILSSHLEKEEDVVEGSLYWVFQKRIQARQKIGGFREVVGESGETRCGIVLEGPLVPTVMSPKKAFQGWRYLTSLDAPADLCSAGLGSYAGLGEEIPAEMRQDLLELCLI